MLPRIDQQLAVQLLSEALSLDHVTYDEVREDWADRTGRFLYRLLDSHPEMFSVRLAPEPPPAFRRARDWRPDDELAPYADTT